MKSIKEIAMEHFPSDKLARCDGAHEICLHCAKCRVAEADETYNPDAGIASVIDATVLKAEANATDIEKLCEMANEYKTASLCINSYFIPLVKKLLDPVVKTCTVINFPLGAGHIEAVAQEADAVIKAGADEVDMVQNLAAIKSGNWDDALKTVQAVASLCLAQDVLLKVILETCYLSREELILSCLISKKAGAKYVKTSTGFGTAGAKAEDIALMRKVVGSKLGVKASGGIRTPQSAKEMLDSGASRIGASSVVTLL
ncbi:MAG: deoxyribose-phosphate aldolase [Candidatus Cloacimonetes bacterium]|jgi:deoxyribose-phosphate aldolase|nr:deoxyribose-phosphate aldolase [Candidatus Cloacimonadota bacterium]